jgi:hypothetical protein
MTKPGSRWLLFVVGFGPIVLLVLGTLWMLWRYGVAPS